MSRADRSSPPQRPRRLIGELVVTSGVDAGLRIAVTDDAVLGRDAEVDVVLRDAGGRLSRRHAKIRLEDGAPVLEDLGSTNGTFLNGERISQSRSLATGDRIEIGDSTLEFTPAVDVDRVHDVQATRASPIATGHPGGGRAVVDTGPEPTPAADPRPAAAPPTTSVPPPTYAPPDADGELRIDSGPGAGNTVPVRGSATIGREPECDLQLLDSEVSRRHAKVTIRDGAAVIDDLHSANGTYVNGDRILEQRSLGPDDRIQIGEATIVLSSPVFAGVAVRPAPVQVTGMREILTRSPELLRAESGTRKWWTLAIVLVSAFMLLLDVTIVGVALPSISKALHPSFVSLQWIVDAYSLMLTVGLLTAGSLADIYGRKRLLAIGLTIFTVASVICAQAPNPTALALARGLQGIGGATMYACLLALIVQEFPARERAIAFGLYGAVSAVAVAMGPIVGGVLVQTLGWQSIFYLNVPIGIATLIVMQRKVVNLPGPETSVDGPGLVTFCGAVFLGVFATIRGNDTGWTSPTILGCYLASVILFGLFVVVELRRTTPMFDLRLFKNPTFVGSSVSAFTLCFSVIALIFFFTIWFQSILGYSPIGTGARMLVFAGVGVLVGPLAGKLTASVDPRYVLTAGLLLAACAAFSMTGVNGSSSWTAVLPGLVLAGVGLSLVGPTLASTATGVVPPWRGGMAGGMNSTMRQFGTTAGIAVLGTLLQHQVLTHVQPALQGSFLASGSKGIANGIAAGGTPSILAGLPAAARPGLVHIARVSYSAGLSTIFLVAGGVATIGAITAFSLVRRRHLRVAPPQWQGGGPPTPPGPPAEALTRQ
ncbi:MAG TPA: MFS transporter [Solirubrobacteraceae bacterium]|nr:MFS transporter [Solirubrobacteraceae bacterium]